MIPLRFAILCLAAGCVAGGSEVARVDLKKPIKYDLSQPPSFQTTGGRVFDAPKPNPHRVPSLSVDIERITKISFPAGGSSTYLHIVLENIGTDDLTLPIGVDSLNLLAAGAGRTYLSLAVKGSEPNAPDLASAKLAMNAEHPESAAKLKPGDTISIELSLGEKPQGVDSVLLTAVISLHQITTSEGAVRDEVVGSEVRSELSRVWR
jgi:hypothetical protein